MKSRTCLVGASTPSLSWSQTNGFYKKTLTEEQELNGASSWSHYWTSDQEQGRT